MAVAVAERTLPNGMYHRMENLRKRFNNRMKLEILGSVAIFEVPGKKSKKKPHKLTLRKGGDNSCRIDWTPAQPDWGFGRLEYAEWEGFQGMLESDTHFWKLSGEEYSSSRVAELEDAGDAEEESAAASASAHHLPETHSSDEGVLLRPDP
jgi:hypothetical protein